MLTSEEVADILGLETISSPDILEKALQERLESYQKGASNTGAPKQVRQSYRKKLKELEAQKEAIQLLAHSLKATQLLEKAEEALQKSSPITVKVYLDEIAKMDIEKFDQDTQLRFKILSAEVDTANQKQKVDQPSPMIEADHPQIVEEEAAEQPDEDVQETDTNQLPEKAPPVEESPQKIVVEQDELKEDKAPEAVAELIEAKDEDAVIAPVVNEPVEAQTEAHPPALETEQSKVPIAPASEIISQDEFITETVVRTVEPTPNISEIPCLTLRYKDGTRKLHIFNLSKIRMGRSTSNDFIVRVMPYGSVSKSRIYEANKLLSRYHATFELNDGSLRVLDGQEKEDGSQAPSGNGVYVNGEKIESFTFPTKEESTLTLAGLPNNPDITQWAVSAIPTNGAPPQGIPSNKHKTSGYFLKRFGALHEDVLLLSGSLSLAYLDTSLPEIWISSVGHGILLNDEGQTYDLKEYAEESEQKLIISSVGALTQDLV